MLTEVARIVAVDDDGVWVETVRQSTCGTCSAQKACGHGLLNQISNGRRNLVKVLPGTVNRERCHIGDDVVISIPESVVLKGSMIVYMLPIISMLAGAAFMSTLFGSSPDAGAALGSILGLALGFAVVRWHGLRHKDDAQYQPTLVQVLERSGNAVSLTPL
jgi:sigma-E factor negative regulatory protein RseC